MTESDVSREQGQQNHPEFSSAGKNKLGYAPKKVDEFFALAREKYEAERPAISQEDIQSAAFPLQRNGYVIGEVDAALTRLEHAIVDKETAWDIQNYGTDSWRDATTKLADTLLPRADRPVRERFEVAGKKAPGYKFKQVDELVDKIAAAIQSRIKSSSQETFQVTPDEQGSLSSLDIENIIFTQTKGKRGYDEKTVDAYLNRAVQVFSRLESAQRLSDADQAETSLPPSPAPIVDEGALDFQAKKDSSEDELSQKSNSGTETPETPISAAETEVFSPLIPEGSAHSAASSPEETQTEQASEPTDEQAPESKPVPEEPQAQSEQPPQASSQTGPLSDDEFQAYLARLTGEFNSSEPPAPVPPSE